MNTDSVFQAMNFLLQSERLRFRPFQEIDHTFFESMFLNEAVMEFIAPYGSLKTKEQIKTSFQNKLDHWNQYGFGFFIMEDVHQNKIGYCGFRLLGPRQEIELGYILDQPYWGQGYASEAVEACLAWGQKNLQTNELIAVTAADHRVSQNVLSKYGFTRDATRDGIYHGEPALFWSLSLT